MFPRVWSVTAPGAYCTFSLNPHNASARSSLAFPIDEGTESLRDKRHCPGQPAPKDVTIYLPRKALREPVLCPKALLRHSHHQGPQWAGEEPEAQR